MLITARTSGQTALLGRASDREVVLTRILRQKLAERTPACPMRLRRRRAPDHRHHRLATLAATNREVRPDAGWGAVAFRKGDGELVKDRMLLFDFDERQQHFLLTRAWVRATSTVAGRYHRLRKRPAAVFIECKNIHKSLGCFEKNFPTTYTIPHIFITTPL